MADLDTGAVLGPGETGEIQARSPSVMAGYLPDEATADAFADGWYRTGDVGWLEPEGWVHLTDRSKEMIKVNGFQVAPAEVEAVLHGHPAVVDCAVFGVADERAGEVPVAAVQLDPDRPVADGELERLVADSLATYKHLRRVVEVDAIPRLPSGKVLRRTLRDTWAPAHHLGQGGLTWMSASPPNRSPCATRPPRSSTASGRTRSASSTTPSGPASSTPPSPPRAGASCAPPPMTARPWASGVEVALVAEELGRGLADAPFLGPTLAAELRRLAGAPPAAAPETVALAPDLSAVGCRPDGTPAGGCVAVDARGATSALMLVPAAGGHTLAQVALADGAGRVDLTRADGRPSTRRRRSSPCPTRRSPSPTTGTSRWTALGLALTSADLVGTMRGAVQLAADYAKERRQYGKAIGSFQAVQHLLADAFVAMEGARSAALHAAWAVDALPAGDALAAAAVAKAYSARAARTVCETAIQVHGGIGNTWECLAHVHLRRALLSSDVLGGTGANLARVLDHHGI